MKNTNVRIRGFEHGVVAACISALLAFVFIDAFAETAKVNENSYSHKVTFTTSGYGGSSVLADFPVLVRLSADIPGFKYSDFTDQQNGGDLRAADAEGNLIPLEIDTWDIAGTSLVWVAVAELTASTEFSLYYGSANPQSAPSATGVWSAYAGVWHLNEEGAGGFSRDATANGLHATNALETTSEASGMIGRCRRISGADRGHKGGGIIVTNFNTLGISSQVSITGWIRHAADKDPNWDHIYYKRNAASSGGEGGWAVEMNGANWEASVRASNSYNSPCIFPGARADHAWIKLDIVFSGPKYMYVYTNGVEQSRVENDDRVEVKEGQFAVAFGTDSDCNDVNWKGEMDELRIAGLALGADWIKAEYDTETRTDFLTSSGAVALDTTAPYIETVPTVVWNGNEWVFSMKLDDGEGVPYAIVGSTTNAMNDGSMLTGPTAELSLALSGLAADTVYSYAAFATNAAGSAALRSGTNTFLNGEVSVTGGNPVDIFYPDVPGTFIVSRPAAAAATALPLTVAYAVSGDAVAGADYAALAGAVTIPAGESSATIEAFPRGHNAVDKTLTITLTGDAYRISPSAATASITVRKYELPVWTFAPTNSEETVVNGTIGYLTDGKGNWKLRVKVVSASERTLCLGDPGATEKHAIVEGSGALDLGDVEIVDAGANRWRITESPTGAFYGATQVTELTLPTSLTFIGNNSLCESTIEKVTLRNENITELPGSMLYKVSSCKCLVMDVPNVGKVGDHFANSAGITNSWADFLPLSATNFGQRAFAGVQSKGDLVFTNGVHVAGYAFNGCSGVGDVRFESKDPVYLDRMSFYGPSTTNLLFGSLEPNFTMPTTDHGGASCFISRMTNVVFYGKAPTNVCDFTLGVLHGWVDSKETATDSSKPPKCIVHCDQTIDPEGWAAIASPFYDDTESAAAPAKCFGVLVSQTNGVSDIGNSTYAGWHGKRVAWLVSDVRSPYRKSGMAIIIR